MTNAIDIVEADLDNPRHQEAILGLIEMYASDPFGNNRPLSEQVRRELIPGLRRHPARLILLAYHQDDAVGIMVGFIGFSTFQAKPLVNVHDLAVHPSWRGQGIGKQLLEATERVAHSLGCCKLTLEVREGNEVAFRTYRQFGFCHASPSNDEKVFFLEKPLPRRCLRPSEA